MCGQLKLKFHCHVTNEISDVTRLHWKLNVYIVDRLLILRQSFNIFEVCRLFIVFISVLNISKGAGAGEAVTVRE